MLFRFIGQHKATSWCKESKFLLFYLENSLEDVGCLVFFECGFLVVSSFSMIIDMKVLVSEEFL